MSDFIFGKDKTKNIVGIEVKDDKLYVFTEDEWGVNRLDKSENFRYWGLSSDPGTFDDCGLLKGDLHYKHFYKTKNEKEYRDLRRSLRGTRESTYFPKDYKSMAQIRMGFTYFKGSKVNEVSRLSFDIETNGLANGKCSQI